MKIVSIAILGLLLAACGTPGTERPVVMVEARTDTDGVQRIEVGMHSYYFEPSRIVVEARKPVELILRNHTHFVRHSFTITHEALSVHESKWGWGTDRIRFTPTEPGEYRFYCHHGDHEANGMVGTLVVVSEGVYPPLIR